MKFLDALSINIDDKRKKILKELGIHATEKFKLAKDDELDNAFKSRVVKNGKAKIQTHIGSVEEHK